MGVSACGGDESESAGGGGGGGAKTTTVDVAYIEVTSAAPLLLGVDKGFFKAEGLDVKPKPTEGAATIPAVVSGDVDHLLTPPATLLGKSNGLPLKAIAPAAVSDPSVDAYSQLLTPKSSRIKSLSDLAGKKVAVDTLFQLPHIALLQAAESEGANPDDWKVTFLVNGFSDAAGGEVLYCDAPEYEPFWEKLAEIDVPMYLHPRNPHARDRGAFGGREELLGPVWAFAVETGTHALRLVTSGLFDRVPGVTVILGHLGEFLPFAMARAEQCLSHVAGVTLEKPPTQVLREHFYVTVSDNYHTPSLLGVVLEMGADRILFAADYPFEAMEDAAAWFDTVPLSDADRVKIGRTNAERLLRL